MDEEDTIEQLQAIYEGILKREIDDDGDEEVIDYNDRIREAVESGKFRLTVNVNDLRSRNDGGDNLVPR
jgi:hypothetical protein